MAETPEKQPMPAPVALTPQAHGGLRVKPIGNADHIALNHFAKIYTPEFTKAGVDFPIIFVKDPDSGVFFAAVMWGLEPGENLFVEDGRWLGGYFPASVRCYPFAITPDPENNDRLFIGIYEQADVLNKEEGNLIFDESGNETEWMNEVKEFLANVFKQEEMTRQFAKTLDELELLVPQTLSIKNQATGKNQDVSGFFVVDKEKFANLPDDKVLELRKSGALEVIYAHLMSLDSLDKLLRRKNIMPQPQEAATAVEGTPEAEEPGTKKAEGGEAPESSS